jgi:hypothetical protein
MHSRLPGAMGAPAQTNESGFYFIGEAHPGNYELQVEAAGFTKYV